MKPWSYVPCSVSYQNLGPEAWPKPLLRDPKPSLLLRPNPSARHFHAGGGTTLRPSTAACMDKFEKGKICATSGPGDLSSDLESKKNMTDKRRQRKRRRETAEEEVKHAREEKGSPLKHVEDRSAVHNKKVFKETNKKEKVDNNYENSDSENDGEVMKMTVFKAEKLYVDKKAPETALPMDPEAAKKQTVLQEYKRAQECTTLKHKNSSKSAKGILQLGLQVQDEVTREAFGEQLNQHAALTMNQVVKKDGVIFEDKKAPETALPMDPEATKKQTVLQEYKRAQEHTTLKHKNSSKSAKGILQLGLQVEDEVTREAFGEQLYQHAALTMDQVVKKDGVIIEDMNDTRVCVRDGRHGTTIVWVQNSTRDISVGVDSRGAQIRDDIPEVFNKKIDTFSDSYQKFFIVRPGLFATTCGDGNRCKGLIDYLKMYLRPHDWTVIDAAHVAAFYLEQIYPRPPGQHEANVHLCGWHHNEQVYRLFSVVEGTYSEVVDKFVCVGSGSQAAMSRLQRLEANAKLIDGRVVGDAMLEASCVDPFTGGWIEVHRLKDGVCTLEHKESLIYELPHRREFDRSVFNERSKFVFIPKSHENFMNSLDLFKHLVQRFDPTLMRSGIHWFFPGEHIMVYRVEMPSLESCQKWMNSCFEYKGFHYYPVPYLPDTFYFVAPATRLMMDRLRAIKKVEDLFV